jgi:hypothetical protein
VSGGAWLWGHAQVDEGGGLWVVLDSGRRWVLSSARLIKVVPQQLNLFSLEGTSGHHDVCVAAGDEPAKQAVPLPILDDALDGELTRAMEFLKPLKEGDRIRIVLAGPPLAHLTGALGIVEGIETLGLVPVVVDGAGAKLFRREALDLVLDEVKTPILEAIVPTKTSKPIETSLSVPRIDDEFYPGQKVTHRSRWLGKSGSSRPLVPI